MGRKKNREQARPVDAGAAEDRSTDTADTEIMTADVVAAAKQPTVEELLKQIEIERAARTAAEDAAEAAQLAKEAAENRAAQAESLIVEPTREEVLRLTTESGVFSKPKPAAGIQIGTAGPGRQPKVVSGDALGECNSLIVDQKRLGEREFCTLFPIEPELQHKFNVQGDHYKVVFQGGRARVPAVIADEYAKSNSNLGEPRYYIQR